MNYYNDNDRFCAQWLRNLIDAELIPAGDVDERSIVDVEPGDLEGYTQCHFFAGLGGWPLALDLAEWPLDEPVWTGSCPCQPFSKAGNGLGIADARHLWPVWYRLITQCRPAIVFGEQVATADVWFDQMSANLEAQDYAIAARDLPAIAVDAQHIRQRRWFVAHAIGARLQVSEQETLSTTRRRDQGRAAPEQSRWPAEPDVGRVAYGVPGRVGQLRALGNAIVPQVAAKFIIAARQAIQDSSLVGGRRVGYELFGLSRGPDHRAEL